MSIHARVWGPYTYGSIGTYQVKYHGDNKKYTIHEPRLLAEIAYNRKVTKDERVIVVDGEPTIVANNHRQLTPMPCVSCGILLFRRMGDVRHEIKRGGRSPICSSCRYKKGQVMIADPQARESSPQHLHPDDVFAYTEHIADLKDVAIPFNTHILNIHQLFDSDWNYIGAYYSCNSGTNSAIFWIWVDPNWHTLVFENSPVPMYRYIGRTFNVTSPNYRGYGNCKDWMLLSAGSMSYSLFLKEV